MIRSEWNALVARYTAALVTRVNTHDPALVQARDMAVADALLAVLDTWPTFRVPRPATPEATACDDCLLADMHPGCVKTLLPGADCDEFIRDPGQKP